MDYKAEIESILNNSEIILGDKIYNILIPMFEYHGINFPENAKIIDPKIEFFDDYFKYKNSRLDYLVHLVEAGEYLKVPSANTWDEAKFARMGLEIYLFLTNEIEQIAHEEMNEIHKEKEIKDKIAQGNRGGLGGCAFLVILLIAVLYYFFVVVK